MLKALWYQVEGDRLCLYAREGREVRRLDPPFRPYFFVERGRERVVEYFALRKGIPVTVSPSDLRTLDGREVSKVEVDYPYHVPAIRDSMPLVPTYEADVPYARRVVLDMGWRTSDSYEVTYVDIEVAEEGTGSWEEDQIVSVALRSNGRTEVVLEDDEEQLLEEIRPLISSVDLMVGYYSDSYDIPKLQELYMRYGLVWPREVQHLDFAIVLKEHTQRMFPSWALDYVARRVLGEGRMHADKKIVQLTDSEIRERCARDVELLDRLEGRLGLVDMAIKKASICSLFPEDTYFVSTCIDSLLLRKARELGYVLPSKPKGGGKAEKHSGAFVMQPPEPFKLYHDVAVYDIRSLYPSIIVSHRISPDPERRLYPDILRWLVEERRRAGEGTYREALKVLANAFYGVLSAPSFRLHRRELGDMVATTGREVLYGLVRHLLSTGREVIYTDTDSCFVQGVPEGEVEALRLELERVIREEYGLDTEVKYHMYFRALYFPRRAKGEEASKKRYAGILVDGTLYVAGMEAVRSDVPEIGAKLQELLIRMHLGGASREELEGLVKEFKAQLEGGMYTPEELALHKTLTKGRYKVRAPHVVAVEKARKAGVEYRKGDKVAYVYCRNGVEPLLPGRSYDVDYGRYWKKIFRPLIERTVGIRPP